ncbi:hypothetical protein CHU33_19170 [Superficieibacter electus]|uniref:Uncharacterized protein n=1 Tax=Superficieibacter electus TaxID=2022662 RepID=A0ABX4ZAG0_9ENTR|nr:hypothetical protein CHU33_19170 [Superficieibacter electus]
MLCPAALRLHGPTGGTEYSLSLRERVVIAALPGDSALTGPTGMYGVLPLPQGEGWGEGGRCRLPDSASPDFTIISALIKPKPDLVSGFLV